MLKSFPCPIPKSAPGTRFTDRKLLPVNPKSQQFAPTPTLPVRMRKVMAGVS